VRLLTAPIAHRVAGAGRLNLDHLGAEVAEELAAERARQQLAHLYDPHVAECAGVVRHLLELLVEGRGLLNYPRW
jgi:hypothetical protein